MKFRGFVVGVICLMLVGTSFAAPKAKKNEIKDKLHDYIADMIRRAPMILPIIIEI